MHGTDSPLVSVVIPAFNAEATIRETLESALAQTYRELEVVVVDDGSTDGTGTVVKEVMRCDPRVRMLRKSNGGLSSARNSGIGQARGSMVAFVDADDLWNREKIAKQVQALQRRPQAGVVYCWFWPIDGNGRIKDVVRYVSLAEDDVYAALVLNNFIASGSTLLVRREVLGAVGGFDESLRHGCEDLDFCLRVAERFAFAVLPEFLVGYRQRSDSMSHNVRLMEPAHERVIARVCERHPELPARLFRWSRARFAVHLARASFRSDKPLDALPFLAKALLRDPGLILSLPYQAAAARLLALFSARRDDPRPFGQAFESGISELTRGPLPKVPAFECRRRAYISRLQVKRKETFAPVER
jgi:cellulose synthase/poly-beta-1,6-N-acetylglucosamine synthase-like glycosyltransferase